MTAPTTSDAAPCVRFAPSPTGFLHVGGARTALFNWLFARSTGGRMLLRIEDTDTERNRQEMTDTIIDLLEWLGIDIDDQPVFQSDRRERHLQVVNQLLADGKAYLCDADNNRVEGNSVSGDSAATGLAVRFSVDSAAAPNPDPSAPNPDPSAPDPSAAVTFTDIVRGEVSFALSDIEDFVIWRSNGSPTFLLANAVDDTDMGITHAIRGEDLLPSAPKVQLIMDAMGAQRPTYAHLPLLVNEKRQKLSKRRDDVSLGDWRDRGYLPQAVANYLATLGWGSSDDIEIRPMSEIVAMFRLEDVLKSPAFFDTKKLEHFNATHIRMLSVAEFLERLEPWLAKASWSAEQFRPEVMETLAPLVQEKVRTLADVERFVDWLMLDDPPRDDASWEKHIDRNPAAREIIADAVEVFAEVDWIPEAVHQAALELGERRGLKLGKAQAPIRVALTGRAVGPPLFESMVLLEREEVLRRLRSALED